MGLLPVQCIYMDKRKNVNRYDDICTSRHVQVFSSRDEFIVIEFGL